MQSTPNSLANNLLFSQIISFVLANYAYNLVSSFKYFLFSKKPELILAIWIR